MKLKYFVLTSLLASIAFIGCASTKTSGLSNNQGLYYENPQTEEKLLIDEWKYMGFEKPFPQWVIPALENDCSKIKSVEPVLETSEIVILRGEGYNQDQAENSLKEQKVPEGYKFYDSFWVKVNNIEKMYISVAVYYK